MKIELSAVEFEQAVVDIEEAIEELTTLSKEVSYFCTDLPERLQWVLTVIRREQANEG